MQRGQRLDRLPGAYAQRQGLRGTGPRELVPNRVRGLTIGRAVRA